MTTIDDIDADDGGVSEVDSNVDEFRENDSKQKKTKKKKLKRIVGDLSPSSQKIEDHEITDDPDEEDEHVASLTSNSGSKKKKEIIVQEEETKKEPQSARSSSTRNAIQEDGNSHSNIAARSPKKKKNGKSKKESKSKSKPLEFEDKKRKKKKTEKSEEEDENRNKISLERAVKRISNLSMENPAEVFLISGDSGIGKSHWIESETNRILLKIQHDAEADDVSDDDVSDDDRCPFSPVICRGTCEISPRINRAYDKNHDKDVSESSTSTEPYDNNGCGTSRPPMHAITEALNNLIRSLAISDNSCEGREKSKATNTTNIYGGKVVWKTRIEEALGITEASYLASTELVPELGVLLNLPGKKKSSPSWDWNSPYKFHRSCLAIRDLLRAISESHHPVIMVLSNLHVADNDTYRLLNFLLTGCHWDQKQGVEAFKVDVDEHQEAEGAETITTLTARLKNFLFIGLHEGDPTSQNDMLYLLERSFCRRRKSSFDENEAQFFQQNEQVSEVESREQPLVQSYFTKIRMERFRRKKVEDVLRSNILKMKDEDKTSNFKENLQDLAGLIYDWTGGNVFYVLQVFEYLKEEGAITSLPSCKWNIDKVQAQSSRWNNSIIGLTATRIDRLPKVVRFVLINVSAFRQTYIEFSVQDLFHLLNAAYADMGRKKKGEMEFPLESVSELENALELACDLGFMKHISCRRNRNDSKHRWAFAHTIIRDEAYSLFAKKKRNKKMEIHMRLGTKASALAFVPTSSDQEWNKQSGDIYLSNTKHDAFKFLAADQLTIAEEILSQDCNKVALLIVETAEMCVSKSAFCAAIRYLTIGAGILERNGGRFTADNHEICLRTYLLLAKLHSVCVRGSNEIDKAFREIIENGKNLKDQIMLHQAEIGISIWQNDYPEALKNVLCTLELLGEKFPQKGDLPKTISRQIENLMQETRRRDNQNLLQPAHCTDKKTFDVMTLLSNVIEISRLCKNDVYQELAMIRMMNICLISGFTPQYSMSFSHYGAILMERAFATNDLNTVKEGYRMGQICEKFARVKNYYGGHSLAIFHHYISHWRRPYRRSLGQILGIYNAQLESGDYFHIQFTTFTYVQYHLTSGNNLAKLDDNLQLFDALYQDYKMENHWKIQLPQRLVANLLGETSDPFLFYGNTIEDQNLRILQMEKAGENDAVQLMYFLILFNSIFFHNHELSKSCLEKIVKKNVISIWKPWIIFFQCLTDILSIPTIEKKVEKKKLKETIRDQRDRLLDWYNQGAVNCSVMVSLIDAEYIVADSLGKKPLPTLRIKRFFDDAIAVAHEQELKHIEAFCFERASMRFEAAGAEDLSAEYIAKARESYLEWNAIAKVDDVEEKHATKFKLAKREKIVGAGYVQQNGDMRYRPERAIGGGRNKIKSINMKGVAKTAGKVKIAFGKTKSKSPRDVSKGAVKSPRAPSSRRKFIQKLGSKSET